MPERELQNVTEDDQQELAAQEVRSSCLKYSLLGTGTPLSLFGIGGGILNVTTDLLNRFVFHMGHLKWLLKFGLWAIGLFGVLLVILAFPGARKFICRCCDRPNRRRRRNPYRSLLNDAETGSIAET